MADAALSTLTAHAKENAPSSLLNPLIDGAAKKLKSQIHDKISSSLGEQKAENEDKKESRRRKRETEAEPESAAAAPASGHGGKLSAKVKHIFHDIKNRLTRHKKPVSE